MKALGCLIIGIIIAGLVVLRIISRKVSFILYCILIVVMSGAIGFEIISWGAGIGISIVATLVILFLEGSGRW